MANWYEDLAKTLDPQPADLATIFAGARSAVPIYALMGATGLNEGEDEALRKLYGPMPKPSMPPLSEEDEQSRMIADFERQFPTPELRRAALQHMRAVRSNKAYDPATATRRVDFMPQGTGPEMRATPPKARSSDLMRAPVARRAFAGGGSAKKTVQQMADELLMKGTKVADKPDLARRSLFGLKAQPAMDFPLARIDDKALTKLEKQFGKEGKAPTLTEKTTTVSPDAGATKSTLKSITETPLSRRTVLKSAAGQVMQSMLPMDELAKLADIPAAATPVGAMAQAARVAPALPVTVESVLAAAMNRGLRKQEAIDVAAARFPEFDFNELEDRWRVLKDPYRQIGEYSDDADVDLLEMSRPAENMRGIIGAPMSGPLMATRPYMRAMREASPRIYGKAKEFSKDAAESSLEGMIDRGLLQGDDEIARFLRNDPSIYDLMGQR